MIDPTIEIRHELHDPSKPEDDVNRWYWWVTVNGVRVVGCYSEHEAEQHRDTAMHAFDLGRSAALARAEAICRDQAIQWKANCPTRELAALAERCAEACGSCADEIEEARVDVATGEGEG